MRALASRGQSERSHTPLADTANLGLSSIAQKRSGHDGCEPADFAYRKRKALRISCGSPGFLLERPAGDAGHVLEAIENGLLRRLELVLRHRRRVLRLRLPDQDDVAGDLDHEELAEPADED